MFEWDEAKRLQNLEDHGVDFRYALRIFNNPVVITEDKRKNYGEKRFKSLGHFHHEHFVVVHTKRGDNLRIISAWKAGKRDKERYASVFFR